VTAVSGDGTESIMALRRDFDPVSVADALFIAHCRDDIRMLIHALRTRARARVIYRRRDSADDQTSLCRSY